LTSVNGEIYTQIGNRAKDAAPMKDTVITTLANVRVPGYIPDDASYGHQTFQVLLSALKPGCAEMGITNAIVDMETQYLNGK
jgi:neutral ceramidase